MESLNIKPFEVKKIQRIVESKETEALLNCIASLEIHAESIGEGGNAEIFAIEEGPFAKVCLKKIKEKQQLICNSIDTENEFQGKVRKAGVRTPLSLISLETEQGSFLIMERINGHTIEEVIQTPSLLSDNFEYEKFIADLESQVQLMHAAGIYHRDLHVRNVMVNEDNMPVIIDFGTATEGSGSDFTYEELATIYNAAKDRYDQVSGVFKDDKKMLQNLKSALSPIAMQRKLTMKN